MGKPRYQHRLDGPWGGCPGVFHPVTLKEMDINPLSVVTLEYLHWRFSSHKILNCTLELWMFKWLLFFREVSRWKGGGTEAEALGPVSVSASIRQLCGVPRGYPWSPKVSASPPSFTPPPPAQCTQTFGSFSARYLLGQRHTQKTTWPVGTQTFNSEAEDEQIQGLGITYWSFMICIPVNQRRHVKYSQ